jgi:hypothetical protein
VASLEDGSRPEPGQASRGRCGARQRLCLLKGCECPFLPTHPQARYCSAACRAAAERWRRWRAGQSWRCTPQGRECRQQQSSRYRQRVREREAAEAAAEAGEEAAEAAVEAGEGQRPARISGIFSCCRPGCYALFVPTPRSPRQKFCSCLCRQALRRVRQREAGWRRRLRRRSDPRSRAGPQQRS